MDKPAFLRKLKQDRYTKIYVILLLLTLAITLVIAQKKPKFAEIKNFISMGHQMAIMANIAFAVTAVIIVKCTDLSTGANLALSAMVGVLASRAGAPAPVCIVLMLLTGTLAGMVNGFLISYMKISPFIATFAMQQLLRGLTISISNSSSIPVTDPALLWLGTASIGGIPTSILLTLIMLAAWVFLMNKTVYGRSVYATGGNFETARASGINARFIQFSTLALTGFMVGLASILYLGRVNTAQPTAGLGLEFDVLTAVFVGGAVVAGGSGKPVGALLGTLLVTVIKTAMNFYGVTQFVSYIVTGCFILLSVICYQPNVLPSVKRIIGQSLSGLSKKRPAQNAGMGMLQNKANHVLQLNGISKHYAGFVALKNITASVCSGQMVGLIGENGAGKSTLVNVLSGVVEPTEGQIYIDDEKVRFFSPQDSQNKGIGVIHQHYSLIPELDIAQNLFYNREPRIFGLVRRGYMKKQAKKLLGDFNLNIAPDTKVYQLTVGQRQLVEVVKSTMGDPWLLIMDEPTSSLSKTESERLYQLIAQVQARNVAIIYISHKMAEVFKLCKRALVLRDGELVNQVEELCSIDEGQLVNMMVGRDIKNIFPYTQAQKGKMALEVKNLSDGKLLKDVSFNVKHGELVVLAGLMGAGRTEAVECVYGLRKIASGSISIDGQPMQPKTSKMLHYNIGFVPEDRHLAGIVPHMDVAGNMSLVWNRRHAKYGIISAAKERKMLAQMMEKMNVKPRDPQKEILYLSGGNQQKVVLGKYVCVSPNIFILDDPTRGVDVGAKSEIHAIISQLKIAGAAILMISSELPELLNVADRIYVMHNGKTVKELPHGTSENEVMHYAFGLQNQQSEGGIA